MNTVVDGITLVTARGVPPPDDFRLHTTHDPANMTRSVWLTLVYGDPFLIGTISDAQLVVGTIEVDWEAVFQVVSRQLTDGAAP